MRFVVAFVVALLAAQGARAAEPAAEVRDTEKAFAKSMADRDLDAFGAFVAEDAVFLSPGGALRGRAAVVLGWKGYFAEKQAPFAWEPQDVEVISSGALAVSRGPVFDPKGNRVGTFVSTWRREADGRWRIVLDAGCPACNCAPKP